MIKQPAEISKNIIASKYLILSSAEKNHLNDIGNGYNREFVKNGAKFIDYEDLYIKYGNKKAGEVINDTIEQNDIEVLIYHSGPTDFHFNIEFFKFLREKVFTVIMLGDTDHYFAERDIYYAQCMDLVVAYDFLPRYKFRQYGIDAITFYSSYDKRRYFKMDNVEKSIDVSFVGAIANKRHRKEYVDYIIENGIGIEVFGSDSRHEQISLEKMVEIFNKTKINLNFTGMSIRNPLKKLPNIDLRIRQMKGKNAEVALCGSFVLSEYAIGTEEVFDINKEIVVFHNKEDMVEKIRYYLEHGDERESIARRGYIRALRDYEISAAIPRLIGRIEEIKGTKIKRLSEVYVDPHFIRNYTTFRILMITRFLKLKRWRLLLEEISIILNNRRINIRKAIRIFLSNMFPNLKKNYLQIRNALKH
jgi:spore maturation protein CgeB